MTASRSDPLSSALHPGDEQFARPGDRFTEFVDILESQRRLLLGVTVGVSLLGLLLTVVVPDLLPPRLLVGAGVGVVACVLGVVAAITSDAADRFVQGPRHVRAAGGALAAVIEDRDPADFLVAALDRVVTVEDGLSVAISPTGIDAADSHRLAQALGEELASDGRRVLVVDVSRSGVDAAGVAEYAHGSVELSDIVEMHPNLRLAYMGPGRDLSGAIEGFPRVAGRLPRDVDVLVVATPGVRHVGVLPALTAVDRVLLLVEAGRTERAELMAVLEAMDVAGIPAEVVLADGHMARRFGPYEPRAVTFEPEEPTGDVVLVDEAREGEPDARATRNNESARQPRRPTSDEPEGRDRGDGRGRDRGADRGRDRGADQGRDRRDLAGPSQAPREAADPRGHEPPGPDNTDRAERSGPERDVEEPLRLAATIDTLVQQIGGSDAQAEWRDDRP